MSDTPTSRTLARCRKLGWLAGVVERRLPAPPPKPGEKANPWRSGRTVDLFGCVDVVAIDGDGRVVWIQATSGQNVASRRDKIDAIPDVETIAAAGSLEVWGWRKLKVKRGGVAVRWEVARWRRLPGGGWEEVR